MKLKLLFFLSILFFDGCNIGMEWEGPVSEFSVLMNGEPWEDNPPPISNNQILRPVKKIQGFYLNNCQDTTLMIYMIRGNYENSVYNKEELIFNKVPFKIGKYQCIDIFPQCYQESLTYPRFVPLLGDDVLGEIYKVLNASDNYISIQSIDKSQEIITGKFQVSFINKNDKTDTVHFTKGNFKVLLSELWIDDLQQIVKTGKLKKGEVKLNVANLPNRIYVLHIYEPEGIVKHQILIQH